MLLGEHRGGHEHGHLPAVLDHLEGAAGRHLGLAVADIAADQSVHGLLPGQVVEHLVDGLGLAAGLIVGKGLLQFAVQVTGRGKAVPLAHGPLCIDVEQFLGDLPDRVGDLFLGTLPALRAEAVEFGLLVGEPLVAAHPVEPVHGHVEFVAAAELDLHEVAVLAGKLHVDQLLEDADAVVAVHDHVPGRQLVDGHRLALRPAGATAATGLQPLVAEQLGRGEKVQALVEEVEPPRQGMRVAVHQPRFAGVLRNKGRVQQGTLQLVMAEHLAQVVRLTGGAAGEHNGAPLLLPAPDAVGQGGQQTALFPLQIDLLGEQAVVTGGYRPQRCLPVRVGQLRQPGQQPGPGCLTDLFLGEEEVVRRQGGDPAADRLGMVGADPLAHELHPLLHPVRLGDDQPGLRRQVVKQGRQPLPTAEEQRQEELHAREALPGGEPLAQGHGLAGRPVVRLGGRVDGRAERSALVHRGEEQLRGRQQHRLVQLLARTLAERVEQADRLDQVAEEIEPQRPGQLLVEHRRIDVDNAAAQGQIPLLADHLRGLVAAGDE